MKADVSVLQSKPEILREADCAYAESGRVAPAAREAGLRKPRAPDAGEDEPWTNWPEPARHPDWE